MSRDYRPYSSASSRPHRAESWQPDRPHGGGRGDRGGDYGDLTSLELECAITRSTGNVKGCAWVFGGSYFWVPDDRSSALVTEHHTYRCDFTMKGTLPQLISTWTAACSLSPSWAASEAILAKALFAAHRL